MTYLHELEETHYLRNIPLIEIKAWYKNGNNAFREVFPNFNIAKKTYNELGEVWTTNHLWESREEWDETRMDIIGQNGNIGYETND